MKLFEFAVIASGMAPEDAYEDALFEAGCDDATLSFQKGVLIAEFSREAVSFSHAIASACQAIASAGWRVERIEPDPLVSLSEIADRAGMSRQAISLYAKGERLEGFPAPAAKITSKHPMWDWPAVAEWLHRHGHVSREAVAEARVVKAANRLIASHDVAQDGFLEQLESKEAA